MLNEFFSRFEEVNIIAFYAGVIVTVIMYELGERAMLWKKKQH